MATASVELRPAYTWDCDNCGREQFVRGMVPQLSEEEMNEIREDHGIQPWEVGDFVMCPAEVKCKDCGATFSATPY